MPHQCLKCGSIYVDGSPQILKGCTDCSGTRFFYTDKGIDDAARSRLTEQADAEIGPLGSVDRDGPPPDGDPRGPIADPSGRRIPTKAELPLGSGRHADDASASRSPGVGDEDWVRMTPTHLRNIVEDVVRRSSDRKPTFRVGAPGSEGTPPRLADRVRQQASSSDRDDDAADDAADLIGAVLEAPPGRTPDDHDPAVDDEVVYARAPDALPREPTPAERIAEAIRDGSASTHADRERRPEPSPEPPTEPEVSEDGVSSDRSPPSDHNEPLPADNAATRYPEGTPPETIAIDDEGTYALDVKRLLEKSPIVVHKDGTYSLHLPSLMEMADRKNK